MPRNTQSSAAVAERPLFGRADQEAMQKDRERTNFFKPSAGQNTLRVLPQSLEAEEKYGRRVPYIKTYTHFGVGGNKSAVCALKNGVRPSCFICKQLPKLSETERKDLAAKQRYRFVIWDYEHPDKGLQIWEIGYTVKEQLDSLRDKYGEFTDVENGFDIFVDRAGEKKQSKYVCTPDRNNSALDDAIVKWASENGLPDLEASVIIPTDAELKALWDGIEDEDDEDFAVEEEVITTKAFRGRAEVVADIDEDEELSEEEEEDDGEAAPAPRASFSRGGLSGAKSMTAATAAGTRRFGRN